MTKGSARTRRRVVSAMLIVLVVATAGAVAHVWTHLSVIDHGYRISKALRQRNVLQERNRRLHIELAVLKDPGRVTRVARRELGVRLKPPEPEQIRRLRPGTSPTVKKVATIVATAPIGGRSGESQ